jgi:predicted alpha/beta hydrolase
MDQRTLRTPDGASIVLRRWAPARQPSRGNVVIGGAMGVAQDFYAPFAQWLSGQGWRVTTFDYRGSGRSAPAGRSLRGFDANLFDWAADYAAVIDHAHAALPHTPLYLLGHSLGAQLPGLLPNQHKVSGLLSVAAGSGYWRQNAPGLRRVVLLFWFVLVPLATRLCGYFPGRRLGVVGDLPAGVVLQWRRWCLSPRYSVGAEGEAVRQRYASARFPVHALSVDDDELMTLPGIRSLVALYENAPGAVERIAPRELGIARLGHFGAFRREREADLWPRLARWLAGLATMRPA